MKKMLFLVVAGILLMGIFAVAEELSERSCEKGAFSFPGDGVLLRPEYGGSTPCGGGGDGGGPGGLPG